MESPEPHFTRRVENYIKYRPRYPQALISFSKEKACPKRLFLRISAQG